LCAVRASVWILRENAAHLSPSNFKRLVNFLNLRKTRRYLSPALGRRMKSASNWDLQWRNVAQIVSAVAALCAVVGVIFQLSFIRGNAKEASARQVYMSYSEATLK
jgi:hypothetical protein